MRKELAAFFLLAIANAAIDGALVPVPLRSVRVQALVGLHATRTHDSKLKLDLELIPAARSDS